MSVCDTSDPDWWKAKFLGRVGFFPSKYCARLSAGERPLQVIQNLQLVESGDRTDCTMTLLRDQIVVQVCMHYMNAMQMQYVDSVDLFPPQVGDEMSGTVMVRSADNRQGVCPIKYLTEV